MTPSGGGPSGGRGAFPGQTVPEIIGRYRVERWIGRGGQGDVYLAHHPHFEIDVAIKVLLTEYRTEEFLERFKLDARILAQLTAPNIVRVYDFDPSYPYLVMEYCGDGDLNQMIKSRKPLPLPRTVSLIRQICQGLIAAHERDDPILHRDLKPGNVLFQKDVPKVADFGLAKVLGGVTSGLTTTRGMMGTVGYASPEQLKDASKVDHRTDLWAVGIMLYELLTFRSPFEKPGDDFVNVAIKVRTEPPAEPSYAMPEPLWGVVQRSLEKRPADRFASARELAQALEAALAAIPGAEQLQLPPLDQLGDVDRMASRVADSLDSGSTENARTLIQRMKEISPQDSLVRYWEKRVREVSETEARTSDSTAATRAELDSRYSSIESLIARREYAAARRECGKVLIDEPDDTTVQTYLQQIAQEESRLASALEQARQESDRARSAGDLEKVVAVWSSADEQFPDHPDIKAELAVAARELQLRERIALRKRAQREAQRLRAAGDLPGAVRVWDDYLATQPGDPEAVAARQALQQELSAKTRAERLDALAEEARKLRAEDRPEAALAVLEQRLSEAPGDEEIIREVETLRLEIADRRRKRLLEEARAEAQLRLRDDDLQGALSVWQRVLRDHPAEAEVREQVEKLGAQLAEREQASLAAAVKDRARVLAAREQTGRYRSVPDAQAQVGNALAAAGRAGGGDPGILASARDALDEARAAAEARLAEVVRGHRLDLRTRLREATELLPGAGEPAPSDAERVLDQAVDQTIAALGETRPPDAEGDPVVALAEAGRLLRAAMEHALAGRQEAIDRARARAGQQLGEAEAALVAMEALPESSRTDAGRLRATWKELQDRSGSRSADRLAEVAQAAATLRVEAESAGAQAMWGLCVEVRSLLEEALELASTVPGDRLHGLISSASEALEPAGGAPLPAMLASVRDELRSEVAVCRRMQAEAEEQARSRWERALQAGDGPADPALAKQIDEVKAAAEKALAESRFREVEQRAARLESLLQQGRIESIWSEQRSEWTRLEGPADEAGVAAGPRGAEAQELLVRYREAMARGATDELGSLGQRLQRERKRAAPQDEVVEVPSLSRRARKLNQRYHPTALERFDHSVTEYEHARQGKARRAELAQLASAARRSHGALLPPPPLWRRVVPAAVAAALLILALAWPSPTRSSEVTLISLSGAVRIVNVSPEIDLPASAMTVTQEGVTWSLERGAYVVETEHGQKVEFVAPRHDSVFIPGATTDYASELVRELDLEALMSADEP